MSRKFQLLKLSDSGPTTSPPVRARTGAIHQCASFVIPGDSANTEPKARSQERDLRICERIVKGLQREGFEASKAARFKPFGAGTHISDTEVELVLMITAKPRLVAARLKCRISTWTRPHNRSYFLSDQWARMRSVIETVLHRDLKADSLIWMAEDEPEDHETSDDSRATEYLS